MPFAPTLEALVPVRSDSPDPAPCLRALLGAGVPTSVLVPAGADRASSGSVSGVHRSTYAEPTPAAAANAWMRASAAEVVLLVAPQARILPGLPADYARSFSDPAVSLAYGTYRVRGADGGESVVEPFADRDDLSEWSSTGYVQAVRRDAWLRCGGYDPELRHAAEYALRLGLGDEGGFARVARPLYEVVVPGGDAAPVWRRAAACYFTREAAELPGFAYLMMPEAVESEVDRVFEAALRRRGALLEGPCEPLVCPHGDASPVVSVILATRDRRRFVAEAVASVLEGSFRDFELIVVDNGSRDGTHEVLAELARRDPRVRVHPDRSEKSIAAAHNLAVAAARGRYVSQLDSDDTYAPHTLARQVEALERNPSWALAISYYELVDEIGELPATLGVVTHDEFDRNTLLRTSGAGAVRTWHRCAIEALGGFDAERCGYYAEDYDLVLRLCERWEVGRVREVLYRCRLHASNNEKRLSIAERAAIKTGARRRALDRRAAAGRSSLSRAVR